MSTFFHIDLKSEYRKSKINVIKGSLATTLVGVTILACSSYDAERLFTFELFGGFIDHTFPYIINVFVNLQICTLFLCLKQRFGWLNKKISSITLNLQHYLEECDSSLRYNNKNISVRPITHV